MDSIGKITSEMLKDALDGMILSASGWRALFNMEESEGSENGQVSYPHSFLTSCATKAFVEFLKENYPNIKTIILGRDSRPTGEVIEKIAFFSIKEYEPCFEIKTVGISPIPEIMSYAKMEQAAFFYISASHNPIGYNGFKFGIGKEGVFASDKANILIESFKKNVEACDIALVTKIVRKAEQEDVINIESKIEKRKARKTYFNSAMRVISCHSSKKKRRRFFKNSIFFI